MKTYSNVAPEVAQSITEAFFSGDPLFVEDLDADDPIRVQGQAIGDLFTFTVDYLRSLFPNEHVRDLMKLVWDIVGSRTVPVASGPPVPTVTFTAWVQDGKTQGVILLPTNWDALYRQDPLFHTGGVVFAGSQARDFYHGRIIRDGGEVLTARARAYEAEYLKTLPNRASFNPYQKEVLAQFPQGFETPTAANLLYETIPFGNSKH